MRSSKSNIGNKIRNYRLLKSWSQRDLAERAGLSPSHISEIENNNRRNLQITTVKKIAAALGMPLEEFFEEEEEGLGKGEQECYQKRLA